jgi:tRNA-2-methylthio-N6-dimethylallyladenosine synthase
MTSRRVYIETYGCQMNELDSELVQGQLESLGYSFVAKADDADVVLLNTCSVRDHSEHKVWSYLGRLGVQKREEQREVVVGVLGCMAERESDHIFARMPHVDVVCGPSMLDKLPALLDDVVEKRERQSALVGHTARRTATLDAAMDGIESMDLSRAFSPYAADGKRQAYVRITRGCNKFCAFCVVPYTRGPEVHRPAQHIVDEVKRLVDSGVAEVTLITTARASQSSFIAYMKKCRRSRVCALSRRIRATSRTRRSTSWRRVRASAAICISQRRAGRTASSRS